MEMLYAIGEVAKLKNISIKTLRYYHQKGILIPRYIDPQTSYRFYTVDQFPYIDIIKGCRALGTSIEELQQIFQAKDMVQLLSFLQAKKEEVLLSIANMQEVVQHIDTLSLSIEESQRIFSTEEIGIQFFPQREVLILPCPNYKEMDEVIYYSKLENIAHGLGIQLTTERGILYRFTPSGDPLPHYIFSTFKGTPTTSVTDQTLCLSAGNYLTLSYSKEMETSRVAELVTYMQEHQLTPSYFMEVELLHDLFNTDSYSCQLQMKIDTPTT